MRLAHAVESLRECCVAGDERAMLWRSGTNAGRSVLRAPLKGVLNRTLGVQNLSRDSDTIVIFLFSRVKRVTLGATYLIPALIVSIHARVKRATVCPGAQRSGCSVSIHARVKRATRQSKLRGEELDVSIHARVKRATTLMSMMSESYAVSIHARVKRATN